MGTSGLVRKTYAFGLPRQTRRKNRCGLSKSGSSECDGLTLVPTWHEPRLRQCSARTGDVVAVHGLDGIGYLGVQYAAKMGNCTRGSRCFAGDLRPGIGAWTVRGDCERAAGCGEADADITLPIKASGFSE